MFQYALSTAVLLLCTYTDCRERKVYKAVIAGYLLLALLGHFFAAGCGWPSALAGLIPGLVFLLLALLSKGEIGIGDGALILACGFSLGFGMCIAVLLSSLFFACIWAVLLLCFRKKSRKSPLAFIPFLLAGVLLQGFLMIGN